MIVVLIIGAGALIRWLKNAECEESDMTDV